jgi:serine/threonine-protein kinase
MGVVGGTPSSDWLPLVEERCRGASAIAPARAEPYARLATALYWEGMGRGWRGEDPRAIYARAAEAAERAHELDPADLDASTAESRAFRRLGIYERDHGQDPTSHLQRAIAAGRRAVDLAPHNPTALGAMANGYQAVAEYQASQGVDPASNFRAAIDAHAQAARADPSYAYAWSNQLDAYAE